MEKVVSVQKEDGKKIPSKLDLKTGKVHPEKPLSGDSELVVKGSKYPIVENSGSYSVSMDDLKEIIFDIQ